MNVKSETINRILRAPALLIVCLIAACGGGGGDSGFADTSPPPPPPPGGSGWTEGVFLDASTFQNQCQNPRSGTDPATGAPFVDVQGSTLDENNFLRSYSDNTYLWYDEIVDQDPGTFGDPLAYFDQLRTFATTPSGQPRDQFHFTIPTDEYFQLSQGGVSAGYGATWSVIEGAPPREVVIAFTEPNSPATNLAQPLARGARVLAIDGEDMINGNDTVTLNNGLYPGVGRRNPHVRDPGPRLRDQPHGAADVGADHGRTGAEREFYRHADRASRLHVV